MQDLQAYAPHRSSILTAADLRRLSVLNPRIPVRDTLVHWAWIVASWAAVAWMPNPFIVILAVLVVGVNFYGLYIIGHDGLHRRLFNSANMNDLWNDMLVVGSFGAITRMNRGNHMLHHRVTCLPNDPDRHKYVHDDKELVFPFIFFLSGLSTLFKSLENVFVKRGQRPDSPAAPGERYTTRDLSILFGWQIALIVGLTLAIGWWAYIVLWLIPAYVFGYRADLTRVFCEHAMLTSDINADASMRLVSYTSNPIERMFFAPHNMNYHMAHHLWPSIPYYRLPEADKLIQQAVERVPSVTLVWRSSYVGFLLDYARWRMSGQTTVTN